MTPQKISNFFLPKVGQTPYPKSQTIRNHVSYAKIRVIIVSARGGLRGPPPTWEIGLKGLKGILREFRRFKRFKEI